MENWFDGFFDNINENVFSLGLVPTIILAAVTGLIVFIIIKCVNSAFRKKYGENISLFVRLIDLLIIIIAAILVLSTITPLKTFAASLAAGSGVAAVVIGIAAKDVFGNIFSGISISVSKPFKKGDYVYIIKENVEGYVLDIGFRHVTLKSNDDKIITIPNSVINQYAIVTENSDDFVDRVQGTIDFNIAYESDLDTALSIVRRSVFENPIYAKVCSSWKKDFSEKDVVVRVHELADYSIVLRAILWAKDPISLKDEKSDLRIEVLKKFKENNIEIPYPYNNVILKKNGI